MSWLGSVKPTDAEVADPMIGDEIVAKADVTMDRGFTIDATPDLVFPWLEQLGKGRAGWYFPRSVDRFIPSGRRAIRDLDPRWSGLAVGDVIPDYGGKHETFTVVAIDAPSYLVYDSRRGNAHVSWAIGLTPVGDRRQTRVRLRLRIGPLKRPWLARSFGEVFDLLTIAGMAAGLAERVEPLG